MCDLVIYPRIYMGVTTPVARVPIPTGNKASKASQCETVREEEKTSSNCWKDEASGG